MKIKSIVTIILATLLVVTGTFSAMAAEKPYTVVFVGYSSTNVFWLTLKNGAEEKAKELGIDFADLTAANPDVSSQKSAVDNAILQKVDGIIVGAVDSRAFDDSFNKAQEAGIPIVTVDTGIDHPWVKSLISTDNLAAARLAGDYIVEKLGGPEQAKGKKLLILGGTVGHQTGDARRDGVKERAEAAGMEVIYRPADWEENKAMELTENELGANPDMAAIFAAWDPGVLAAKQAVKLKGMRDQVILVGFDAIPGALKAIKEGEIDATIRQDPDRMGREGMQLMVDFLDGKEVPKYIPIDGLVIDSTNVDEFLQE